MRWTRHILICCAAMATTTACKHTATKGKEQMPKITVEIATARSETVFDKVRYSSFVESIREVLIQPRIDGYLHTQEYDDGMPVKKGTLLFTIIPGAIESNLESARAELESALAQEVLSLNNYNRAVPLARIDAISQSDLDQYTATHSAAVATVKAAEMSVKNAELDMSYTKIYSPIDGVAAKSNVTKGDYVGPSTELNTLTTVYNIDSIMVQIAIPTTTYLDHLPVDKRESHDNKTLLSDIEITLSNGQRYPHKGEYYYTMPSSPTNTSTVVIVAKFPNHEHMLKSGMYAGVTSNIGSAKEEVLVPQSAVSQSQGINTVWVISNDSIAKQRTVELGNTTDDMWIIKSGVSSGEKVVTSGSQKIHSGIKVSPILKN